MADSISHPITSLYVHVPFCAKKCAYCAFYSEASNGELINRYVEALIREMELIQGAFKPRTIFFGGGTPSLLNVTQWKRLLGAMERFGMVGAEEWTIECNPATVSADKAKLLRAYGVNRISMGVQSLDPSLLDRLGRIHTRAMVFKSFDALRSAGFSNINLDLMFAIPGQTLATWRETLAEVAAMGSEHLSTYEVIYEEDTPLYAQLQAGQFEQDEDLACEMYEALLNHAAAAGFQQYEVANFARASAPLGVPPDSDPQIPALACRHNVNYWRGGSFYGLGPSATSYVSGVRSRNVANTVLYCERVERGEQPVDSSEQLAPLARAGETAAFGLRMIAGWPFEQFRRVTGHDLREHWAAEMRDLAEQGWGRIEKQRFKLTPAGLRFADAAAQHFLK